jgi:hypothetical protein
MQAMTRKRIRSLFPLRPWTRLLRAPPSATPTPRLPSGALALVAVVVVLAVTRVVSRDICSGEGLRAANLLKAFRDRGAGSDRNAARSTEEGARGGPRGGAGARVRGGELLLSAHWASVVFLC